MAVSKDLNKVILVLLVLSAVGIPYNLPAEIKAPYKQLLGGWLLYFGIAWGAAILVLFIACKFGPELTYDESAPLGEIINWKHFPRNWREMLFVAIFFSGVALIILFIAYTAAYGEPG